MSRSDGRRAARRRSGRTSPSSRSAGPAAPRCSRSGSRARRRAGCRAAASPRGSAAQRATYSGSPREARSAGRASSSGTGSCGTPNAAASASRVMSSGVPPRPPVTIRWSTRVALAPHELDDPLGLVRHRGADHDPHAERLEPAREPRGVRVLGVARDELVPDRQDGGEHMASMQIRDTDPEADADADRRAARW